MPDKYAAQNRYHAEKTVSLTIRLVKTTEADIIGKLNAEPNKAGYIKKLIREDLKKNGGI